ncbi:MAG: glycosyltransferase [Candidatus Nanopelagicales bacterium]
MTHEDWREDDLAAALAPPSPALPASVGAPWPGPGPAPAADDAFGPAPEQPTEWFSVEEYLSEEDSPPPLPRRDHHVTAVVVSHDGAVWLSAALTTLAQLTRPPDAAVGVDTGSVDGSPGLLAASFGQQRTIVLDHRAGFGEAVQAGLDHLGRPGHEPFTPDRVEWVWLLHDDSAPSESCLSALLDTADDNPSAAILGPKILGWHDRRLLLEAGVTVTGSGRRVTGLERREHDQGQHDGVRDVLAVSSAGMLVRRDVWDDLSGFDPALPLFRDDLDFCWRAHRRGERVLIATDAVLHHREASAHGRRAADIAPRPARADREAAVHVLLAHAPTLAAPFVALRLVLGSLVRSAVYLLGKDVRAARDEIGAVLAVALHPSRLRSSRELVGRTAVEPAGVVRSLRPTAASQARGLLEVVGAVATTSGSAESAGSVSGLDSGPVGDDADFMDASSPGLIRRVLLRPGVLLALALAVIAVIGTRGLWLGDGVLQGGALLPPPEGASDLWQTYRQAWHDVGPGSATPSPPYLAALSALALVLLGKAPAAVTVALLLSIPLAGASAYLALRGVVASRAVRVWAGAAYALLPALTGAIASGRIGTTIAAIVLPFALRSLVRISGPAGTLRRAAGTAILVALVMSVAPALWLLLVVAGAVVGVHAVRTRGASDRGIIARLVLALAGPLVLLLPWTGYLLLNPALLLLEPGVISADLNDPALEPWDVLLLHPGGPGMTPLWLTLGIVIGGLLALLRTDRFRAIGAMAALGGLALLLGIAQTMVMVTPPGSTTSLRPWPGQATLLLGLMMIAAAAVGFDGLRDRFIGRSFSLGQPIALAAAVVALLAPVLSAGWYLAGLPSDLRRAPASAVPAFVGADSQTPQAPRTLVIEGDVAGRVTYSLLNGPGPRLGDAETGPPASAWQALDPYVAALASGRGGDEIEALAGYGIRYVLLAKGADSALVPTLDGEPGLRRLSTSGGEVLWRVAGTTSRARVVADGSPTPVGIADGGQVSANPYIDQGLPEGGGARALVIGAALDDGWSAVANGADGTSADLAPAPGPGLLAWSQSFAVPGGAPTVVAAFDDGPRTRWLYLQLAVLLALVVMALPERRRVDPDPDVDDPDIDDPDIDDPDIDDPDVDDAPAILAEAGIERAIPAEATASQGQEP